MGRITSTIAGLALFLVVPGGIWLAYTGYQRGLYAYWMIPIALGAVLVVTFVGLFALLPTIRKLEG